MEWIKRYIYAVTRRLPESQRLEVSEALTLRISKSLDERLHGEELCDAVIKEVLAELGPPQALAEHYREKKTYLVGPQLHPLYKRILTLVLLVVFFATTLVVILNLWSAPSDIHRQLLHYAGVLFRGAIQAFAWVTLVFAAVERFGHEDIQGTASKESFTLSNLPPVPSERLVLHTWDPLFGMVFTVLFGALFLTNRLGIYPFFDESGTQMVPFFQETFLASYAPYFVAFLFISFLSEAVLLRKGRWTRGVALSHIALNLLSIGLLLYMVFTFTDAWNPDFLSDLRALGLIPSASMSLAESIWLQVRRGFFVILFLSPILDTFRGITKFFHAKKESPMEPSSLDI